MLPHPAPACRLERQVGIDLRTFLRIFAELQRAFHGLDEGVSVELQGVRPADPTPEPRPLLSVGLQVGGTLEEGDSVLDLVARDRGLRCSAEPEAGFRLQALQLFARVRPGDVDIIGPHCLGVVMREQRGMLVAPRAHPFDPFAELSMQPCTPRLREAPVRDLSGESMLEDVFHLTSQ